MSDKPKRAKKPPKPALDFSTVSFEPAARPAPRGMVPLYPIHEAVIATYGADPPTAVSIRTPPDVAAFLGQMRTALRKNGHKLRVAYRVENGTTKLWAEDPRVRKARVKKA